MWHELENFWAWAGMTPEEYAGKDGFDGGLVTEFDYSHFEECLNAAKDAIRKPILSEEDIDGVLTVLALDNENEEVLDEMTDAVNPALVLPLCEAGVRHRQAEARWQIAEWIYRVRPSGYRSYLRILAEDAHPYVRRHAKNALDYLSGKD